MDNEALIQELETIKTFGKGLADRADRLIHKLQPVSTGRSKKNHLSNEAGAKIIAKRIVRLSKRKIKPVI